MRTNAAHGGYGIMKYAAAVDIGGTNTRIALVNENYEIEKRIQFPTDAENPWTVLIIYRCAYSSACLRYQYSTRNWFCK